MPGGRPDVWEDPQLNDYPPHAVFTEIMKTIDPLVVPHNFRYQELDVIAKNVLDPVWLGSKKVDDVIEELTTTSSRPWICRPCRNLGREASWATIPAPIQERQSALKVGAAARLTVSAP